MEKDKEMKRYTRRLYRNGDDKILGGVCSGLADYVGNIDVALWRIGFVVLPFVLAGVDIRFLPFVGFWFLPIVYVVLWAIVPEAYTVREKEEYEQKASKAYAAAPDMDGVEVDEATAEAEPTAEQLRQPARVVRSNGNSGCLKLLLVVLLVLLLLPVLLIVGLVVLVVVLGKSGALTTDNGYFKIPNPIPSVVQPAPADSVPVMEEIVDTAAIDVRSDDN